MTEAAGLGSATTRFSGGARVVYISMIATALGVLPVYLTSGMAVFVRAELDFSPAALGLAVSSFFGASALASVPAGRLVEQRGTRTTLVASAWLAAISLGGIAAAQSWWQLVVAMLFGGVSNAMTPPATNRFLASRIRVRRQGVAFALKQASFPLATFGAGLAVPLIGLTLGWRWAFALTSAAALVYGVYFLSRISVDQPPPTTATGGKRRRVRPDQPLWILVVLAFGASCATAAGSALTSFYVESAVDGGLSPGPAGLGLSAGSLFGVATRLWFGRLVDRRGLLRFRHVAVLFLVGGIGMLGFTGPSTTTWLLLATTAVAFGAGWGWHGLFHLAIVKASPSAPAAATGVIMVGMFLGGIYGPTSFGLLAQELSFAAAWTALAISMTVGATVLTLVDRRIA